MQCNLGTINPSNLARRIADVYLADQSRPNPSALGRPEVSSSSCQTNPSGKDGRAYRNQINGAIWKLYVKDAKLVADVPVQASALARKCDRIPIDWNTCGRTSDSKNGVKCVSACDDKPVSLERSNCNAPPPHSWRSTLASIEATSSGDLQDRGKTAGSFEARKRIQRHAEESACAHDQRRVLSFRESVSVRS